jgi:hypothetical protein
MVWANRLFLYITDIYFDAHSSAPFDYAARSAAPLPPPVSLSAIPKTAMG